MRIVDLRAPEIGGFAKVIQVLVKPGDTVTEYAPIVMLESEEATFEIPATRAGTIRDVKVKLGDTVTEGNALASVWVTDNTRTVGEDADDSDDDADEERVSNTVQPRRASQKIRCALRSWSRSLGQPSGYSRRWWLQAYLPATLTALRFFFRGQVSLQVGLRGMHSLCGPCKTRSRSPRSRRWRGSWPRW